MCPTRTRSFLGVLLPALAASLAARGVRLSHTIFVPPESQYGFLATKKHPAPPGSSGAAAVGGTGSAAAAPQLTAAAAAAQGAAAAGAAPAGPDFSWQEQLQAVWEAHCLPAGHGPKPGEEAAAAAAEGPKLPGVPGGSWGLRGCGRVTEAQAVGCVPRWGIYMG